MTEKELPPWVFEIERICHDRGRRLLLAQADNIRLRETLKRVVREARRQHSGVLDEIQERDYLAPCKYCKQPPVVDIDLVPPDGPETTTFIYCGTKGCPNTEEDELESMVMCFEDSQSLWNYRNAPLTNWIAVEIEKERDNALAEVERLRELLLYLAPTEAYRHPGTGKVYTNQDSFTYEEWGRIQKMLAKIREPKGESDD